MKSKILIDLERLRYRNSGIANVFFNLKEGLVALQPNEQIFVYGPQLPEIKDVFPMIKWSKFQKFNPFFGSSFQLVHVSHQLSSYFHHKHKNQKKIVTLHDLNFLHEDIRKSKRHRNIRRVRKNVQNADVIVCISEFVKKDYLKNRHLFNVKSNQEVTVIQNGLQFPDRNINYDLGQFSYLKDKKFFLNIGVLFPKKNQLSILKAIEHLEEDLVLVVSGGKKEYEKEVLQYIEDHELESRVHILRNITNEEKYALIQHSQAMLHPSLAEGFGIPPIEAMYFGKPVFLSTLTSLPEIGGPHVFYFESFEAKEMAEKIKSGMLIYCSQENYADNLHLWAMQFDYRKMASNYLELYRKTLNS